jgi:TPR repeat protein
MRTAAASCLVGLVTVFSLAAHAAPPGTTTLPVTGVCENGGLPYRVAGEEALAGKRASDPGFPYRMFFAACSCGDAMGCHDLGVVLLKGVGVQQNPRRAAAAFETACTLVPVSCLHLGQMHEKGSGVAKDLARAASLYERACDGGNVAACDALGVLLLTGDTIPRDPARATRLFQGSCDGGDAGGCRLLGVVYEQGLGTPPDLERARTLYRRACDKDLQVACSDLKRVESR